MYLPIMLALGVLTYLCNRLDSWDPLPPRDQGSSDATPSPLHDVCFISLPRAQGSSKQGKAKPSQAKPSQAKQTRAEQSRARQSKAK